jgi:hypothetical protein
MPAFFLQVRDAGCAVRVRMSGKETVCTIPVRLARRGSLRIHR